MAARVVFHADAGRRYFAAVKSLGLVGKLPLWCAARAVQFLRYFGTPGATRAPERIKSSLPANRVNRFGRRGSFRRFRHRMKQPKETTPIAFRGAILAEALEQLGRVCFR